MKMEASVDPQCGGPDWTPITPKTGSLFHAETHKSRFTEEQIIKVLKEHAAGLSAGDVCRKHGISDATFYKWRSRFGGMEVSDARRLKALEEENRKLKKLLAETMLDASTLKEMLGKNF
jgi:putative transposase